MTPVTYKSSGVDIDAGNQAVVLMKDYVKSTFNKSVLGDLGSFGGLFEFDKKKYRKPVLVSSTDGVGTKIKVALLAGKYDSVGQDLVNHCVNDILVQGARPLFFLDYVAMGKLEPKTIAEVVRGLAKACREQGTVLIGGETAEMPGMYLPGEFDLAGTIVGVVEKDRVINGRGIKPGDAVLALPSVGLHTNGFSLARKVLFEMRRFELDDVIEPLGEPLGQALLKPHRCYAGPVLRLLEKFPLAGLAHITGGGLENIPRILPKGCQVRIKRGSWPVLPIFQLIVKEGQVPEEDAYRTLNMGLGMILVVKKKDLKGVLAGLKKMKEPVYEVGEVVKGEKKAILVG
jgi:phosphoribosylformylglycinamidine cyclo-ligase